MSRKRHNPKDVVGLDENLTPYEMKQSQLLNNVMDSVYSLPSYDRSLEYMFWFSGRDGNLIELPVNSVRLTKGYAHDFLDRHPSKRVAYPVLIRMRDGSTEYGFKTIQTKTMRTGKRQLVSYYVKDGIMNPSNGKWEYPCTLHGRDYPSAKVMKLLPLWNGVDECLGSRSYPKEEYDSVLAWMTMGRGCFVKSTTGRPQTPMSGITRCIVEKPQYWNPPKGYESWHNVNPVFMAFVRTSYLKSVYRYEVKDRLVGSVYKLSDLLSVTIGKDNEDDEPVELWNSLDSTCHGIF